MSLQIASPYIRVEDANGLPYVGAKLYIYLPETTTLASVYTDDGLSISAANPATSNAKGEFPRIYIAAGTYKLRAETVGGSLIFEEDNIDTGLSAGTGALPISRGGTGATTAAAARAALDVPSNSQLTDLSTTISDLQSSIQNIVSMPQGYLTPTSGVPVIASDVTAATAVYYTPLIGGLVPLYDGTQFNPVTFSELTLTLNSNHVADAVYDVFFTKDTNGTAILVTGPAWSTTTAGSGSRGSGAGTTELTRISGLLVNKYDMPTARNGATTYAISANKATYVGSIYMDHTAGQVSCHRSWGQNRKWGIWNAYNRKRIILVAGDGTSSWTYNTATVRASNNVPSTYSSSATNVGSGTTTNSVAVFMGLAEEEINCVFRQALRQQNNNSTAALNLMQNGIGINSITAFSGMTGCQSNGANTVASISQTMGVGHYASAPSLGITNVMALESGSGSVNYISTFLGTNPFMSMAVEYMG